MEPYSLLLGLTIVFAVLGTLGLLISLMVLEWPSRKRATTGEHDK